MMAANRRPNRSNIKAGTGEDGTIRELAEALAQVIGYAGQLDFDATKPDGTPRKLVDVTRLTGLGWPSQISLREALART